MGGRLLVGWPSWRLGNCYNLSMSPSVRDADGQSGRLIVAATPLGNLSDASPRLVDALTHADVVAAEDTRVVRRLISALGVDTRARIVSFYDEVEKSRAGRIVEQILSGSDVVLVSDAGMPTISDPGFGLVRACADAGVEVTVVPGPSAVTAALAVAGLPTDRFTFEGFLPRKPRELRARLDELADEVRTMVFFESPRRLASTLELMADAWGAQRSAVVCRELTKKFEEVRRGSLAELFDWSGSGVRGEITLVVAGQDRTRSTDEPTPEAEELADEVRDRVGSGDSRKDAIAAVAARHGLAKRIVYNAFERHKARP